MKATLLVICDDLLFWSKIEGAARAAGVPVRRARSAQEPLAGVRRALVDLQASSPDPFDCAAAWKGSGVELVGFVSHVDGEAQARARSTGFHRVLARSAFVRELPELVRIDPGDPGPPGSSPAGASGRRGTPR